MLLVGFVLFRLFDVWKPWPISWLDRRVKGGMGVMVDDVVAGVFAAIVLALGLQFLH
jgi:phosphatidylglycerophosphatase A